MVWDEGLQDGNTGRASRQVHEVTNDGNTNETSLESIVKEAPPSYANKLSPKSSSKGLVSCEGYLEDAADIRQCYYQCLRVNTYFVLAIDESFLGVDVAILMTWS
ncbi:hypothetical protein Tco_1237476 [Tanacetum coccineum]